MPIKFTLIGYKNLPAWVNEVIHIAKGRCGRLKWNDTGIEMLRSGKTQEHRERYHFPWSFEFDDLVMEGCLAYLKALERPGLKNPGAYARTVARHAMGDLIIKEGRSHGLIRDKKRGGMKVPVGINPFRMNGRRGSSAINAAKTHCIRGHPLSGDNVRYTPQVPRPRRACNPKVLTRHCVTCKRERDRERQRRRRAIDPVGERKKTAERVRAYKARQRALQPPKEIRTHCKNGHELSGENVMIVKRYRRPGTWTRCRTCHRTASMEARRRRKQKNGGAAQGSSLLQAPQLENGIQAAFPISV